MAIRMGAGLLQAYVPKQLIEAAESIEDLGYDDLWYAYENFYRDMWVGLTIAALHIPRLRLGTFLADSHPQHPALTAITIASLVELACDRIILLMGAGTVVPDPSDWIGTNRSSPSDRHSNSSGVC